jgi:hypothetical protein
MMASLMESLLTCAKPTEDWEEFLDRHSIDRYAVSSVEGGWELIDTDCYNPSVDDLNPSDYRVDGPPVYEVKGYIVVRGFDGKHRCWYVFEPATTGLHAS